MGNLLKVCDKSEIVGEQQVEFSLADSRRANKSIMPEKSKNQADRILKQMEESYQKLEKVLNAFNRMP